MNAIELERIPKKWALFSSVSWIVDADMVELRQFRNATLVRFPASVLMALRCVKLTEYNLEFQGSVLSLQKRALYVKFYPEMRRNNTTFGKIDFFVKDC